MVSLSANRPSIDIDIIWLAVAKQLGRQKISPLAMRDWPGAESTSSLMIEYASARNARKIIGLAEGFFV